MKRGTCLGVSVAHGRLPRNACVSTGHCRSVRSGADSPKSNTKDRHGSMRCTEIVVFFNSLWQAPATARAEPRSRSFAAAPPPAW
eukprot:507948-Rhodomonas_salina.2